MGGWTFVEPRLRAMGFPFEYVGRDASASPATGSHHVHEREQTGAGRGGDRRRRCRTWWRRAGTAVNAADGRTARHGHQGKTARRRRTRARRA